MKGKEGREDTERGRGVLDASRATEIDRLFARALEISTDRERQDFLQTACAADAELLSEVEALLAAAIEPDSMLDLGEAPPLGEALALPERLGPYQPLRQIGRGGMGVVYLAERVDGEYHKEVALKVLRIGSGPLALARFTRERQILAQLEHPAIARLYDGGTTEDGEPYLVMEHVEGLPIDRYCQEHDLPLQERLRLLMVVCDAVQAAHRQLIVHRDLKPSNILVDQEGKVKLLDFGIAKLLDHEAAKTATEHRPMTPQYASPEQVRGGVITVSSDIYQLGLLAYELLTGERPYNLSGMDIWRWQEEICSRPSPSPSTVVARCDTPEKSPSISSRELRGDLDAIVLMALRKEPERRYGSADLLRRDFENHLAGRPVSARPDTWGYRFGKLLQRHARAAAAVGLSTLAFLFLSVAFLLSLTRERDRTRLAAREAIEERDRAESHRQEAEHAIDLIVELFDLANPMADPGEPSAREILERGAERVEGELTEQPALRARLLYNIGRIFTELGEHERARELAEKALAIRESDPLGEPHLVAESLQSLAAIDSLAGRFAPAREKLDRAYELTEGDLGSGHPRTASILESLGNLEIRQHRYTEAEAYFRRAEKVITATRGADSIAAAMNQQSLGTALSGMGRLDEARAHLEKALEIYERRLPAEHPRLARAVNNLAIVTARQGDHAVSVSFFERALEISESSLGANHPSLWSFLNNLAISYIETGRFDEAYAAADRALRLHRDSNPENDPIEVDLLNTLGNTLNEDGDPAGAERFFREARELALRFFEDDPFPLAFTENNLGEALAAQGEDEEAEELFLQSRRRLEEVFDVRHVTVSWPVLNLARLYHRLGRRAEATELYELALGLRARVMSPEAKERREAADAYAVLLRELGRVADAERVESRRESLIGS